MIRPAVLSVVLLSLIAGTANADRTSIVPRSGGDRSGSGGGDNSGKGGGDEKRSAPARIERRTNVVPRQDSSGPRSTYNSGSTSVRERTRIVPRSGVSTPPPQNTSIIRSDTVIHSRHRHDTHPRRYNWHTHGGTRYAHYYDRGAHWYGFYSGPHFYWTRYHNRHWWWFDVGFGRWLYWSHGRWWWPGPTGVVYVYNDDRYVRYDEVDVTPPSETPRPPEEEKSQPDAAGGSWTSPDGRRMVQIFGPRSEAFLYDTTGKEPVFMTRLGESVEKARFTGGTEGKPLQILLDYNDGSFKMFTADGKPA